MTLEEAKKILHMALEYSDGRDSALFSDEDNAIQTVLDYLDEGLPERTVHELKLGWNFCDPVLDGRKTFELRKNDRGFQTGDLIRFVPIRFDATETADRFPDHPIKSKLYEITYMLNGWGLNPDCVALGIKEVEA